MRMAATVGSDLAQSADQITRLMVSKGGQAAVQEVAPSQRETAKKAGAAG